MTTIDLYKKHKAGEVSREKFLYEVRRDAKLPWIISVTSYDDAIKILKNKGIIRESVEETKVDIAKEAPMEEMSHEDAPVDEKLEPVSDEDIEIYVDELGMNVDKKMLGKFFAENNLYEREEDALLKHYGFYNDVDDVMDVLRFKDRYKSRRREFAESDSLQEGKKKQPKALDADHANPYQYRLGIQYELECSDDYTDEGLEKAKAKTLRNLAKDSNYYTALQAKKSSYTFKTPETDKPGMQAKADGYLKKEAKKDAKANVKDNLGKKEQGTASPKGVKEMTQTPKKAKGISKVMDVPGKPKVVKEGVSFKDFFLTENEEVEVDKKAKNIAKIKSKLKKEAVKFTIGQTGQEHEYKSQKDSAEFEKDLKVAGVKYTKSNV
jgi:hypothetical protein